MDKKTWFIGGAIVLAFAVLIGASMLMRGPKILDVKYDDYNVFDVIPADEYSGNIAEHVVGDPDAPIKIFEYADYQCEGCAAHNPYLNKLVEEYDGKVAVVYRGYLLSYHQNATAAASAATAAGLQGYWKEYKDMLFTNQDDWYSSTASQRQQQFEDYFVKVTNGEGDLAKFRKDMSSQEVAQKIAFDKGLAEYIGLEWTPLMYINDTRIERSEMGANFLDNMRAKIDEKIKELGLK